jgi:hypothetical protein
MLELKELMIKPKMEEIRMIRPVCDVCGQEQKNNLLVDYYALICISCKNKDYDLNFLHKKCKEATARERLDIPHPMFKPSKTIEKKKTKKSIIQNKIANLEGETVIVCYGEYCKSGVVSKLKPDYFFVGDKAFNYDPNLEIRKIKTSEEQE